MLEEIVRLAEASPGMRVLDLGTGTGNLAARFAAGGCTVVCLDCSHKMLSIVRRKVPTAQFVQADLRGDLEPLRGQRFDRIVSAYVFHEFPLPTKVSLLTRLARAHLTPGGRIVIGDISFPTAETREKAHQRWSTRWDETEDYWAADEAAAACERVGFHVHYEQISCCGGIFVFPAGLAFPDAEAIIHDAEVKEFIEEFLKTRGEI